MTQRLTAQKRRTYAAMLDSLSTSFKMMGDTDRLMISFNPYDVADLLAHCRDMMEPGPRSIGEPR